MTGRLADISARIAGIRQLGAVVNAMRGIAAARAQQARGQLVAVDSYAATIAAAIGRTLALLPEAATMSPGRVAGPVHKGLVLFCAEQGFAGAFSERVLDAAAGELATSALFLIGTRGAVVAGERGVEPEWKAAMASHSPGIPKLADQITEALLARVATGDIDELEVVFSQWRPGNGTRVERRRVFPLEMTQFPRLLEANPPLHNLAPEALLSELATDYLHAQLCNVALHAFAAENEARMEAMAAGHSQIERELEALRASERLVRQDEITAEIIELAAGETASRACRR